MGLPVLTLTHCNKKITSVFTTDGYGTFYLVNPCWLLVRPRSLPTLHTQQRLSVGFRITVGNGKNVIKK